jgi:hypothetical protein
MPPIADAPPADPDDAASGDADLGGYSDIGGFHPFEQSGPVTGTASEQEASEVLAILSALQYVPSAPDDTASESVDLAVSDAAKSPTASPSAALSLPSHSDGGMIELPREPLVVLSGPVEISPEDLEPRPRPVPVQMDRIIGRFQEFEVSTVDNSASSFPSMPEALSLPSPIQREAALSSEHDLEQATESPPTSGESPGVTRSLETGEGPDRGMLVHPEGVVTAGPSLLIAAASVYFAYAGFTSRAADVREPDSRKRLRIQHQLGSSFDVAPFDRQ